jgi:tRNA(Ile2) C34 agmatinyltransferase TiaS
MPRKNEERIWTYTFMEALGTSREGQIDILRKICPELSKNDVDGLKRILAYHAIKCEVCGRYYFPSGSKEVRCYDDQRKHRTKYWREWKRNKRAEERHGSTG